MIKLYYFLISDESGEMNTEEFETESQLEEFFERHDSSIEVFDVRY